MGTVSRTVEPGTLDPEVYDPRILARREVRLPATTAGEQIRAAPAPGFRQPVSDGGSCLLGDFELDRPADLLLDHGGAVSRPAADAHVIDAQRDEIAAA